MIICMTYSVNSWWKCSCLLILTFCSQVNKQVDLLTKYLMVVLEPLPYTFHWRHRGFWRCKSRFLARDGVHLNNHGSYKFFRSLRGAVLRCMRIFMTSWFLLHVLFKGSNTINLPVPLCCSLPSQCFWLTTALLFVHMLSGTLFPMYRQVCYIVQPRSAYHVSLYGFGHVYCA